MANSLIVGAVTMGMSCAIACPDDYKPDTEIMKWAEENGDFMCSSNILECAKDADVIYTDVWASMGQEEEKAEREKVFKNFQINDEVMSVAKNDAMVLHCLPAHREEEITAKVFEENVKQELAFLDMPKMQFYVDFNKGNLSSTGYDKIEFLISANPGEPPKSLSKVASGGELSRIMLAIKNIISYNDTIGTLIFDEIDTGVSGRASQKIGLKLKSVSKNTQVICVTHSAQIASNADEHFLIQKKFNDNKTFTCVTPLDFEGRKQELARIMGGLEITDTLLQSAEELLNQNLCSD